MQNIFDSFKNNSDGWSARKLTAFAFVCMAAFVHLRGLNDSNALKFLIADGTFALICLGIVTVEQIIKLKHETNIPTP